MQGLGRTDSDSHARAPAAARQPYGPGLASLTPSHSGRMAEPRAGAGGAGAFRHFKWGDSDRDAPPGCSPGLDSESDSELE
jgi:hypothetical protein